MKVKVKEMGSYLETDQDGFLINPTSIEKIQEKWRPVLEEVKQEYRKHFKDAVVSIYIRGSVAKGEAVDCISDVDSFAVVSLAHEKIDTSWEGFFNKYIQEKYPFVAGVEITVIPASKFKDFKGSRIMIKTQSVCIFGEDLAWDLPPMKPGFETVQHVKSIEREINETKKWLQEKHSEGEVQKKCTWIMKRILRSGFELVMERSHRYTRDLYKCFEGFSKYYPERKEEMYRVLELAINPTADRKIILGVLENLGEWLGHEVSNVFGALQK